MYVCIHVGRPVARLYACTCALARNGVPYINTYGMNMCMRTYTFMCMNPKSADSSTASRKRKTLPIYQQIPSQTSIVRVASTLVTFAYEYQTLFGGSLL